jgi:hypothetical protein
MRRIAIALLLAFGLTLGLVSLVAAQGPPPYPAPYYGYPAYNPGYPYGYWNWPYGPYGRPSGWSGYVYNPAAAQGPYLRFGGGLTCGGPYLRLGGGYIIDRSISWGMPGW